MRPSGPCRAHAEGSTRRRPSTSSWARVAGVAIGGLVIIANFLSLPYYPVWSVVVITISGFVIWALCVVQRGNLFDLSEERPRNEGHSLYEERPPRGM